MSGGVQLKWVFLATSAGYSPVNESGQPREKFSIAELDALLATDQPGKAPPARPRKP